MRNTVRFTGCGSGWVHAGKEAMVTLGVNVYVSSVRQKAGNKPGFFASGKFQETLFMVRIGQQAGIVLAKQPIAIQRDAVITPVA